MPNISVTGIEQTIAAIRRTTGKTEAELKTTVKKAAYTVEAVAREKCKVKTGTLRRSIHAQAVGEAFKYFNDHTHKSENGTLTGKLDEWTYLIGTNVAYGAAQENRNHYLAQGARAAEKDFPELVTKAIRKVT